MLCPPWRWRTGQNHEARGFAGTDAKLIIENLLTHLPFLWLKWSMPRVKLYALRCEIKAYFECGWTLFQLISKTPSRNLFRESWLKPASFLLYCNLKNSSSRLQFAHLWMFWCSLNIIWCYTPIPPERLQPTSSLECTDDLLVIFAAFQKILILSDYR